MKYFVENWQSGKISYFIALLFGVIIAGSIVMSNGIFPAYPQNPLERIRYEISKKVDGKKRQPNLQLQYLRVKCDRNVAVNFLIDTSGSMREGNKIAGVQAALRSFAEDFPGDGVISMQTFSDRIVEDVTAAEYGAAAEDFDAAVAALQPQSGTRTRDGFSFALQRMNTARLRYPNHEFHLIVISDGIPETSENNRRLGKNHQYDPSQDPSDVAAAAKQVGITVHAVALEDTLDAEQNKRHQAIMKAAASSSDDFYSASEEVELPGTLTKISKKMCG